MHTDEVDTDPSLVQRLLAIQFPQWADLPIEPVLPLGTDNANYRLGESMVVRLPRHKPSVKPLELERRWLPYLAPHVPLAVPVPIGAGEPGEGFPFTWSVYSWVEGEPATLEELDPEQAARELATFILALQAIDIDGAPTSYRGGALAGRDEGTRTSIAVLGDHTLLAAWETALAAPEWDGEPVWVHGDLDLRNLLAADGRLAGVLDWGCTGIGDPACDVAAAWKVLPAHARELFRDLLDVDDATWARARGWVLHQCALALPYYTPENNAALYFEAERWLGEALAA